MSANVVEITQHQTRHLGFGREGFLRRVRDLIERGKLDIAQLHLADLLAWVIRPTEGSERLALSEVCGALEATSRLALLKARRLVGMWQEVEAEEAPVWLGPPAELPLRRSWLAERIATGPHAFFGPARSFESVPPALAPIAPQRLRQAILAVLGRNTTKPIPVSTPVVRRIPIETVASQILEHLDEREEVHLHEVVGDTRDAHIAAFLACLTMARQGHVAVEQPELFGAITLRRPALESVATA